MRFLRFTTFCFILIISCNHKPERVTTPQNDDVSDWVSIHIDSKMKNDTTSYYYYGQISRNVIEKLKEPSSNGMFSLKNIRYFNPNDQLEVYEDIDYKGEMLFKLKDVIWIEIFKKDPILIFDSLKLADSAKDFLKYKRNSNKKE